MRNWFGSILKWYTTNTYIESLADEYCQTIVDGSASDSDHFLMRRNWSFDLPEKVNAKSLAKVIDLLKNKLLFAEIELVHVTADLKDPSGGHLRLTIRRSQIQ